MPRIVWTAEAAADLEGSRYFIARTSPHYGSGVAARVIEAMDRVRDFPNSGRIVPEIQRGDIREVIHGTYRVVYRVREEHNVVEVLTVFRASREFPTI